MQNAGCVFTALVHVGVCRNVCVCTHTYARMHACVHAHTHTCIHSHTHTYIHPANKEPFLNQLARVILVHKWYRSTSICFHVYSREYTCSACCHEF